MTDAQCVDFLQWALPQLHMRWSGFRKVHGQVCKRLANRLQQLQLADINVYREYLATHETEWRVLDGLCRVTISRFYREKAVFRYLEQHLLPGLIVHAENDPDRKIRMLSLGSASGEEPYTLAILWCLQFQQRYPQVAVEITATDANPVLLQRAAQASYSYSSIRNLPPSWRQEAFESINGMFILRQPYRQSVTFIQQDIRHRLPDGPFDLILCRNLVFTYFDDALQSRILEEIADVLRPDGFLVIGIHEALPAGQTLFVPLSGKLRVFIKKVQFQG